MLENPKIQNKTCGVIVYVYLSIVDASDGELKAFVYAHVNKRKYSHRCIKSGATNGPLKAQYILCLYTFKWMMLIPLYYKSKIGNEVDRWTLCCATPYKPSLQIYNRSENGFRVFFSSFSNVRWWELIVWKFIIFRLSLPSFQMQGFIFCFIIFNCTR